MTSWAINTKRYCFGSGYDREIDLLTIEFKDNYRGRTQKSFANLGGRNRTELELEIMKRMRLPAEIIDRKMLDMMSNAAGLAKKIDANCHWNLHPNEPINLIYPIN